MTSSEEPRFAAYRGCDDIVGQDRGHEEKDRSGGLPDCEWMIGWAKRFRGQPRDQALIPKERRRPATSGLGA